MVRRITHDATCLNETHSASVIPRRAVLCCDERLRVRERSAVFVPRRETKAQEPVPCTAREIEATEEGVEVMSTSILEWISVNDALPESGVVVLAAGKNGHGEWHRVRARYAERFTIFQPPMSEYIGEYSEENDEYYLEEGWWEQIEFWDEYSCCRIADGVVTHWMPLPEPPSQ